MSLPALPLTDTKDWTWVLDHPCADCGYDASAMAPPTLAPALREDARAWRALLDVSGAAEGRPGGEAAEAVLTRRPDPRTWSPTEYACHVRDVHLLFARRVALMLAEDGAAFPNWDQDATAVERRYDLADPATTVVELGEAAERAAATYETVPADGWGRRGRRSDGSAFTVATLGAYHLHDAVHHRWDVRRALGG